MNNSEFFNSEPMDLDFEKTAPKYEGAVAVADETIEKNITNDSVKSTIIREDDTSDLYEKSYLIDLTQVQNLTEQSLESINALLNGGEVAVYIEHSGVRHYVGDGKEEFLFRLLPHLLYQLYDDEAQLYVYKNGKYSVFDKYNVNVFTFHLR